MGLSLAEQDNEQMPLVSTHQMSAANHLCHFMITTQKSLDITKYQLGDWVALS